MPERRRKEGGADGDSVSRREGRDRDSRRARSRPDREREREPSPKRSRDGKMTSARKYSCDHVLDTDDNSERKHRRRFQDAPPVENSSVANTMMMFESQKDGSNRKADPDGSKRSSDPAVATRRRSFFQHNDRGSDGRASRVAVHSSSDDGRSKAKEHTGEKVDKRETSDINKKYERTKAPAVHEAEWKHDRFFELEGDATVPQSRPSLNEKKMTAEKDSLAALPTGSETRHRREQQMYGAGRREEKGNNYLRGDEPKQSINRLDDKRGDRYVQINEMYRTGYQTRERHNFRERTGEERFAGRYGDKAYQQGGLQVEKWMHDLYDEANRSPTPKNEEEQIAKIEALLSR